MFNGIIFNQGIVKNIKKRPKGINIFVKSNLKLSKKDIGVSVACDGVCLTLISLKQGVMEFYLSKETIERSKFRYLKVKDKINLELPLKYGQKISGHICQGHVDTLGKILDINKIDKSYLFDFEIAKKERKNLIEKASICINGISLTISKNCLFLKIKSFLSKLDESLPTNVHLKSIFLSIKCLDTLSIKSKPFFFS